MLNLLYLFLLLVANVLVRKGIPYLYARYADPYRTRPPLDSFSVRCTDHKEQVLDVKSFECLYSEQKKKRREEPLPYAFCVPRVQTRKPR
jgi:hypothetical protein